LSNQNLAPIFALESAPTLELYCGFEIAEHTAQRPLSRIANVRYGSNFGQKQTTIPLTKLRKFAVNFFTQENEHSDN